MALWCVHSLLHLGVSSLWEVQIYVWLFKFSKHWLKMVYELLIKSSSVLDQWVLSFGFFSFFYHTGLVCRDFSQAELEILHLPWGPVVCRDHWFLFSQVLNSLLWFQLCGHTRCLLSCIISKWLAIDQPWNTFSYHFICMFSSWSRLQYYK